MDDIDLDGTGVSCPDCGAWIDLEDDGVCEECGYDWEAAH